MVSTDREADREQVGVAPRAVGYLLLASSAALVLTGLLHPRSGRALLEPNHDVGPLWYVTHVLGVGVWPVLSVGFALLTRRLARLGAPLLSATAFASFIFAAGSATGSGLLGGFVRPRLAAAYQLRPGGDRDVLTSVYDYNTTANETFADAYQVALAVAIALWSIGLIRTRPDRSQIILGWVGAIGGVLLALAFVTGVLSVQAADFHVFVLANLGCTAWIVALGVRLVRSRAPVPM